MTRCTSSWVTLQESGQHCKLGLPSIRLTQANPVDMVQVNPSWNGPGQVCDPKSSHNYYYYLLLPLSALVVYNSWAHVFSDPGIPPLGVYPTEICTSTHQDITLEHSQWHYL